MNDDTKIAMLLVFSVIILTIIITTGILYSKTIMVNNFQNTIKDLSNEQKCLHICGLQYYSFLDSYKFCIEKCNQIYNRTKIIKVNENDKNRL